MPRGWLGFAAIAVGCGGPAGPDCDDLRHSPIEVDLSEAAPVFSFEGDKPHGFAVLDVDGVAHWELICACPPDGCFEDADWEARACLPSPLTYGVAPDVALDAAATVQGEPLPLDAGQTYTALIWSVCNADAGPTRVVSANDFDPLVW